VNRRTVIAAIALALAACTDPLQGLRTALPDAPSEVTLSDFGSPALGSPSAFDMLGVQAVRVDLSNAWDFLFFITSGGQAEIRPRGNVIEGTSEAGVQLLSQSFDAVMEDPMTGYVKDAPVPVAVGDVLAVVSRRNPAFTTLRCRVFAKIEIEAIDLAAGTMKLRHFINPNCEDPSFIPDRNQP